MLAQWKHEGFLVWVHCTRQKPERLLLLWVILTYIFLYMRRISVIRTACVHPQKSVSTLVAASRIIYIPYYEGRSEICSR